MICSIIAALLRFLVLMWGGNEDSLFNCLNCLLWYALLASFFAFDSKWCILLYTDISTAQYLCTNCNVLYSIYRISNVLYSSVSLLSTDVSTAQYVTYSVMDHYNVLYSIYRISNVLYSIYVIMKKVRAYCTVCHYCLLTSVMYIMSVLSTDVSTVQYLRTK